ncbi:MAG: hypothetical protein LCH67_03050 [Bacteroidetes bacterium]|nr:hypothetical protein [Bacteroidota bacterium]
MKKTVFTFLAFLILGNTLATVRRVNNNVGVELVPNIVYSAFKAAHDDSSPGDTIYIEPSNINYIFTDGISKRLVIIGNGYNIGTNAGLVNPLPQNTFESKVQGFESAGGGGLLKIKVGAQNSSLIGLSFQNSVVIECGDVLIERCQFIPNINLRLNSNNNLVKSCFTKQFGSTHGAIIGTGQNNTIENCILGDGVADLTGITVSQSVIDGISNITNGNFTNCIVNSSISGVNNTYAHCLKIGDTFPTPGINNNIENIVLADVFVVSNPLSGNGTQDKDYQLKVGSAAIGTGFGGVDMGAFGGATPYRLSGQPPVPVVTNLFLNATGSTTSGLTGSITIQSNN